MANSFIIIILLYCLPPAETGQAIKYTHRLQTAASIFLFFFLFSFLFLPSRRAPCILLAWCIELERAPKLGFPAAARAQKRPRRNKGEKTHYWAAILGLPALVEIQGGAGSTVQASP